MNRYTRYSAYVAMYTAVTAVIVVLAVGLMGVSFGAVFSLFGIDFLSGINKYALGFWGVLAIYVLGGVSGFLALRRPRPSGSALILVGVIAIVFGGPLAKIFGIIEIVAGGICILMASRPPSSA